MLNYNIKYRAVSPYLLYIGIKKAGLIYYLCIIKGTCKLQYINSIIDRIGTK